MPMSIDASGSSFAFAHGSGSTGPAYLIVDGIVDQDLATVWGSVAVSSGLALTPGTPIPNQATLFGTLDDSAAVPAGSVDLSVGVSLVTDDMLDYDTTTADSHASMQR